MADDNLNQGNQPQENVGPVDCTREELDETLSMQTKVHHRDVDETQDLKHSPRRSAALPIQDIAGYQIIGRLGQGAMGTVWRAVQEGTNREVALKLMNAKTFDSEEAQFRFRREVELAAMLDHPNIAKVFDSGIRAETHYYAMQLVEGTTLEKFVRKSKLSHREIVELLLSVCRGVEVAHRRGVIHRDLKPSNIVVSTDGHPYVLDFGLAKSLRTSPAEEETLTQDGQITGTLAYMAPEQAAGDVTRVDMRSDVYALGVILYRLLTGQPPHDSEGTTFEVLERVVNDEIKRPRDVDKSIDVELEAILVKALSKSRRDRYGSAGSLANDFERYLNGDPLDARPPTAMYFLSKRLQKYRGRLAMASLALIGLVALIAYGFVRERDLRGQAERAQAAAIAKAGEASLAAGRAQVAESKATKQAERALAAEALAQDEANTARRQLYFNRIALANQYCQSGRWEEANDALDACPFELRHWEWSFLKQQANRFKIEIPVPHGPTSYCFSKNDEVLFIGSWTGMLLAVDVDSGNELWTYGGHTNRIQKIAVADTNRFATAGDDNFIKIWSYSSSSTEPTLIREFDYQIDEESKSPSFNLSPDGTRIALVEQQDIVVFDVESGDELSRCKGHENTITDVAFNSADGSLVSVSLDETIRFWESDGSLRQTNKIHAEFSFPQVRLTSDGSQAMVTSRNFQIFDARTGEERESRREALYYGMDMTSSGDTVVLREFGHLVSVLNTKTLQTIYRTHSQYFDGFAISNHGRLIACPKDTKNESIQIIDISPEMRTSPLANGVLAVCVRNDLVAISDFDDQVLVQRLDGVPIRRLATDGDRIRNLAFSNDGEILAARTERGTTVWSMKSGSVLELSQLKGQRLATVDTGTTTYVVTTKGEPAVWMHQSDALLQQLTELESWEEIRVGQDSRILAIVIGHQLDVWDRESGSRLHQFECGDHTLVGISPNGRLLVASNYRSIGKFWDLETGKLLNEIESVQGPFAFTPDSSRLLSFTDHSKDQANSFRLLNVETNEEILSWEGVERSPIQFSSDGSQLFADRFAKNFQLGEAFKHLPEGSEHNLLTHIQISRDKVAGNWSFDTETLKITESNAGRIQIPIRPLGDYRLSVELTRTKNEDAVGFFLPVKNKHVLLQFDGWPPRFASGIR